MFTFYTAVKIEILKVWKSKILIGTIGFFVFMSVILGLFVYVVKHPELMGNSAIMNAKTAMIMEADWPSYFDLIIQIILTAGVFGFGVPAGWIFGREFVDHVIKDLLALPVSRTTIVMSKFVVMAIWNTLLAIIVLGVSLAMGFLVGLDGWSSVLIGDFTVKFLISAGLTVLLCPFISFFASVSRGYLLPFGLIIFTIFITQMVFVGTPTLALYIPWGVPALYSGVAGSAVPEAGIASYMILLITCIGSMAGTVIWWRRADQA